MERAESLWRHGEELISDDHYAVDCIRPKCIEVQRVCVQYRELMKKQRERLEKSKQLQESIQQVCTFVRWCYLFLVEEVIRGEHTT